MGMRGKEVVWDKGPWGTVAPRTGGAGREQGDAGDLCFSLLAGAR